MPFNLKKLSERRVELMTQLENLVKTCETETRAFNEEEQKQYSDILAEVRSMLLETEAAAYHFMLEHGMATSEQISQATGLSRRGTTQMLRRLIAKDLGVAEGGNRNRTYRAKQ